jgi:hypothetical protein
MKDQFNDLDALRLPPEALASAMSSAKGGPAAHRPKRPRIAEDFYLCPVSWADRAVDAVRGKGQLIIALRIYRRWRLRKPEQDTIVASNVALAGPGFAREHKRRAIQGLQAAGLIEVVDHRGGRAPRIRVVE